MKQYKLIVFCDCPEAPAMPEDKTVLYSYLDGLPEGLAVSEKTGVFPAGTVTFEGIFSGSVELPSLSVPQVIPQITDKVEIFGRFADGTPAVVSAGKKFYTSLLFWRWRQFRELCEYAGCHTYGEAPCTVYGDSRFTAVFSHNKPEKYSFQIH